LTPPRKWDNRQPFPLKSTTNCIGREVGRWGDGEMGRWGDGEMGRWGDGEMGNGYPVGGDLIALRIMVRTLVKAES